MMNKIISSIIVILLALISRTVSAAPITVLPINSFTVEFLSDIPTGMYISMHTSHDGVVGTVDPIQHLGDISFSLSGLETGIFYQL